MTAPASSAQSLILLHARQTYQLPLPSTFNDLQLSIESHTSIAIPSQTLLVNGRKLPRTISADTPLSDLGIYPGTQLMLLGGRKNIPCNQEDVATSESGSPLIRRLRDCEKEVCRVEGLLADLEQRASRAVQGNELRKDVLEVTEAFMKILIELDSIEGGEEGRGRGERKVLVKRVQGGLVRCDAVIDGMKEG